MCQYDQHKLIPLKIHGGLCLFTCLECGFVFIQVVEPEDCCGEHAAYTAV